MLFEYDATTTRILEMPPYLFFIALGVLFSSVLFMLLSLKYGYNIPRYTKIFFLCGIGLFAGAKLFGFLTGLFIALANNEIITLNTFMNTGIVFYGGLIGFLLTFLLLCKVWNKKIDYGAIDIAVVCIPLFHFWGRLGCFFSGCCYGVENYSVVSVLYTTHIKNEAVRLSRFPVQLVEAAVNLAIFAVLISLLLNQKFKGRLVIAYLFIYPTMRIILENFRGDLARGVWNGISFSQVVSLLILISCALSILRKTEDRKHEVY